MTDPWRQDPYAEYTGVPAWAKPPKKRTVLAFVSGMALAVLLCATLSSFAKAAFIPPFIRRGTWRPDINLDILGINGAVASDSHTCSEMGVQVLKRNGSAADAAIAVALCLGSVNPHSSGIGGGGFILVRHANGSSHVIDCRETAPQLAHKHMFDDNPILATVGGLASGVPGEVAGLGKLYDMYASGNLAWKELVQPVAALNRHGFPRGDDLTRVLSSLDMANQSKHFDSEGWAWLLPRGRQTKLSHLSHATIKRYRLANTLEFIANEGPGVFYDPEGPIAPFIARAAQMTGGILSVEDLASYEPVVRKPLRSRFAGRDVYTTPVPTSGPALLMALNVLESLLRSDSSELNDVDMQHLVEVMKWAAAARSELGDPAFIDNPNVDSMLEREWARNVLGNISSKHTLPSWRDYHPSYEVAETHGTTHFSVVDSEGTSVSMTSTINLLFGNQVCDPVTGIILNSEMDDFSLPYSNNSYKLAPSVYNFIEPGKRPLSSAVPTILALDGTVELSIGSAGGSRILTSVLQALVRIYGYRESVLESVAYPRVHHQLLPYHVSLEDGFGKSVRSKLAEKGHAIEVEVAQSAMAAVYHDIEAGILHAVGDYWRKRGLGAAY